MPIRHRSANITSDNISEILNSLTDAVIVLDKNAKFVVVNPAFCRLTGTTPEQWFGREPKELIADGVYDRSVVYQTLETNKEVAAVVHTQTGVELLSRSRLIYDSDARIKFVVVTSTPMTELDTLRENLERQHRLSNIYLRELEHLRKILLVSEDFIFESYEMKSLLEIVKRVAPLDFTVLITGESGVGKEILAKTIHNSSTRKNGPFIPVTIPAIPESLLEAELFGYKGGAFTGSMRGGKIGLLEVAQGGTLLLDEVGDIPYNVQVKILRAVESGEIVRLGSTKPIRLDIRIIAITNKDIVAMVKKGAFREDLYYRLNVVPIKIKPLRERREDIEPLCHYFIRNINNKYNLNKYYSASGLTELKKYDWPGNVRELRNVVERLAIQSNNNCITVKDVSSVASPFIKEYLSIANKNQSVPIIEEYDYFEQSRILAALKQAGGNKTKAAELLDMTRTKLYRKLRESAK